jgi:hypothetical protein
MEEVKLYPAWRQAEAELLAAGTTYGSIITDQWLHNVLGIKPAKTIPEHEENRLNLLEQVEQLRKSLLVNHRMMLRRAHKSGYLVVHPEKQTAVAVSSRTREVKNAMRKMAEEITHVETSLLSDASRQENSDAQAKLGALRSMFRANLPLANDKASS